MTTPLPEDLRDGDERSTLEAMLAYYRAVLIRKAEGLDPTQLQVTLGPSPLSIGGIVLHTALAEDIWFHARLAGRGPIEPWTGWEHGLDPGKVFVHAAGMDADTVIGHLRDAIARSDSVLAEVESLDQMLLHPSSEGQRSNVRWTLVHMIEEYARHCGHCDLIRESIDGQVDD